jgi:hypothetical protein
MQKIFLTTKVTKTEKAAFPVIDAHNHLWGNWQVDKVLRTMDEVGVISYCDLTGNVHIEFAEGGYVITPGKIADFLENCAMKYPGKFYCFTMSNFAQPAKKPLFDDSKSSHAREFHPHVLTEPCLKLSLHTALLV